MQMILTAFAEYYLSIMAFFLSTNRKTQVQS